MNLILNKTKTIISKPKFTTGFTLVELLVTISIFVILTGVVLFNQSKFNSTILLTNLAYDTALTVRQAQNYGLNIKEFNNQDKFVPYGVHFEKGTKYFILFADNAYDRTSEDKINIIHPYSGGLNDCDFNKGCVIRYSIPRGNFIFDICAGALNEGIYNCAESDPPTESKSSLDIVFVRPNPDAYLKFESTPNSVINIKTDTLPKVATVILSGQDGSKRKVEIRSNGLIQIVH